jgi:hypothetical protein
MFFKVLRETASNIQMTSVTAIASLILKYIGKFPTLLVYSHLLQGLTNIGYQNCILSSRLGIHKELLLPFQIVSRSDFSSCIAFTTPSIPNYKSFQESWRVKASQV